MRALLVTLAACVALASPLRAEENPAPAPSTSTAGDKVDTQNINQKVKQASPAADDAFDLLPPEAKPDPAAQARADALDAQLKRRRTMLQLHQLGGFVTLAGLAATVVVGQLNYADKYGGGGDTGKYLTAHETLALGSAGVFAATGLLALLAPSPLEKPARFDTATAHKVCMGVATAGMVAEIVLGIVTAHSESSAGSPDYGLHQRNLAIAHQVIGYTTFAATAAGFTVLTF